MFPIGPFGHQVGIGDQHARCCFVCFEHADRLAGLDKKRFIGFELFQRFDDPVERIPIARRFADTAIDDEILRPLRHIGIEVVHQHPHGGLGVPRLAGDLRAAGAADEAGVCIGHGWAS